MRNLMSELAALFQEAGHAHHDAFIDVNGEDSEWPIWYADHLFENLSAMLEVDLTKSELIYLLVGADRAFTAESPAIKWPQYYAQFFIKHYGLG